MDLQRGNDPYRILTGPVNSNFNRLHLTLGQFCYFTGTLYLIACRKVNIRKPKIDLLKTISDYFWIENVWQSIYHVKPLAVA